MPSLFGLATPLAAGLVSTAAQSFAGLKTFGGGITWDLGGDADGDTYWRTGGALARLPIGAVGQVLSVTGASTVGWAAGTATGSTTTYVHAVVPGALPAYTVSGGGTVLTANANGAFPTQDGVAAALNNDYLVWAESGGNAPNNGPFRLTQVGTAGTPWILTRMSAWDTSAEFIPGAVVQATAGTLYQGVRWMYRGNLAPTLGVTNILFRSDLLAPQPVGTSHAIIGSVGVAPGTFTGLLRWTSTNGLLLGGTTDVGDVAIVGPSAVYLGPSEAYNGPNLEAWIIGEPTQIRFRFDSGGWYEVGRWALDGLVLGGPDGANPPSATERVIRGADYGAGVANTWGLGWKAQTGLGSGQPGGTPPRVSVQVSAWAAAAGAGAQARVETCYWPALAATANNDVRDVMVLRRPLLAGSAAGAANVGAGLLFTGPNTTPAETNLARLSAILTTATAGAEVTRWSVATRTGGGALTDQLYVHGNGGVSIGTTNNVGASYLSFPNNVGVYFRTAGGANSLGIFLDGSNAFYVGDVNGNGTNIRCGTVFNYFIGGTQYGLSNTTELVWGQGAAGAAAVAGATFRTPNRTGTDAAPNAPLVIAAGLGTGNAVNANGYVEVQTPTPVGAGTGAQTSTRRLRIRNGVMIAGTTDPGIARLAQTGTALVAGDFALSAGWGATASVGSISGDDSHATFTVTASGAGIAANPTIVLTFKDGTWTNAPWVDPRVVRTSDRADLPTPVEVTTVTATAVTLTWVGTPTDTRTYTFTIRAIGY